MKKLMFKLAVATSVAFGAQAILAQEMGEEAPEETAAEEVAAEEEVEEDAAPVAEDAGTKVAVKAQDWDVEENKELNASELVQNTLSQNGYTQGFIPGSRAIIQIGIAQDTVKDAASSKTFMSLRQGLAREAALNARVAIARALRQKMSQGEVIIENDATEFDAYKEKHAEEFAELERQKAKVADLLKRVDAAEAATLDGRTLEDDWNNIVDGIIKRIDSSYSSENIVAEKKARYAEMKKAYEEAKKTLDALKKSYESDPIGKNISDVKACFDLDLYGITILAQAESYEKDGTYQIACAAVWSPKLQERALATLHGKKVALATPGESTLIDWIKSKEAAKDLIGMVGTRQVIDSEGRQYVVGIAAGDIPAQARARQRAQEKTELEAERTVLASLYEITSGTKEKHDELMMYNGDDNETTKETDALGRYAKALSGKTPERPISGLSTIYRTKMEHPFTGKQVFIAVATVDIGLVFEAESLLDSIGEAAAKDAVHTQYISGKEKGRKEVVEKIRKSNVAGERGRREAVSTITKGLKGQDAGTVVEDAATDTKTEKAKRRRTGVISGDKKINADF